MLIKQATTKIYIDKSYPKGEKKECAVYIRVTYNRKPKYYRTNISLSIADFEKAMSDKPGKLLKGAAQEIRSKHTKADQIISKMPSFSFESFEKQFSSNRNSDDTISKCFDTYIKTLKENGQIGTAVSYECARNSLVNFEADIPLSAINADYLRRYERHMLGKSKSKTTISMYLRSLRCIYNKAIEDELISKENYPFGRRKYEIPKGRNTKKALSLAEIELIYKHNPLNNNATRAKDYWMFLYLANGMNMKDMCLLKYENIKHNFIEFERAKTSSTKRTIDHIRIPITEEIQAIINRQGTKDKKPGNHIFPILGHRLSPTRQRQLIQQVTHVVNDHMIVIAKELKLEGKITSYTARHSFATILQRSGVAISFISEALGHSSVTTTQNYLAGFEDEKKIEVAKFLTAFTDNKSNDPAAGK